MTDQQTIFVSIQANKREYEEAADWIWEYAETRFQEARSTRILAQLLEREGFAVETAAAGMDTALIAIFGQGAPIIGLLGEYDALTNLNQAAGVAEKRAPEPGANGRGCGHNALGVGSLEAAVALKAYLSASWNVPTVQLTAATQTLGTPGHSWQVVSQSCSDVAHTGMHYAAQVMALTGLRLFQNPELCKTAGEKLKRRLRGETYDCLLPEGIKPSAIR